MSGLSERSCRGPRSLGLRWGGETSGVMLRGETPGVMLEWGDLWGHVVVGRPLGSCWGGETPGVKNMLFATFCHECFTVLPCCIHVP